MTIRMIAPDEARRLVDSGAAMIDIREPDEHARERIPGASNVPLDRLAGMAVTADVLLFHCRSGMRTAQNAARLEAAAGGRPCYVVEGGLAAWSRAGLPVDKAIGTPIEMQRQVMIAAGMLVLLGTLLSLFVAPLWIALAIFVGAGLTFAGVTGFCGMARILALMPWNRRQARG